MGSLVRYVCCRKKMLGWIRKKMIIQESTLRGDKFFASDSTIIRNDASTCSDLCVLNEIIQSSLGTVLGTTHIYPTHLTKVRG
jgi:hypothetical protein